MSLSIAIVGLPNVGKSTLFNALTKNHVLAANYPFATIEPNIGIVSVPDPRLVELAKLYPGAKIVAATVTFVDIAGLVKGANQGEGLGNKFLSHIRQSSAICQVVRAFSDTDITHVEGKVNPSDDIETINTELILADLEAAEQRVPRLESDAKKDPRLKLTLESLAAAHKILDSGQTLSAAGFDASPLSELNFLTAKPFIYAFNLDEKDLGNASLKTDLAALVAPAQAVFVCAKVEAELAELTAEEAADLLQELGQAQSGLDQLARAGFNALGLQTFLTAGPKETRAWTIKRGATAPEAAGVIHTDFAKGFIRAQVVSYNDLIAAGSESAAKAAGKLRLEGRDYAMKDGDVVEFLFNV